MPRLSSPVAVTLAAVLALGASSSLHAQAAARRPLNVNDLFNLRNVADPQLSPDGKWVAYAVTRVDSAKDRNETDIWMSSWDGSDVIQLTHSAGGERAPRWSPDGRWLAFLSGRTDGPAGGDEESSGSQIWLLDRRGGEASKLTSIKGGVSDYAWSPDSKRFVLVISDTALPPAGWDSVGAKGKAKTAKPIVIDRYHFKEDGEGYLGPTHSHLYLYDIAAKKSEVLTPGSYDESQPSWSPDGKSIAFVSNRTADPERNNNADLWVIDAKTGAAPRQLTTSPGNDGDARPAWSPDGSMIAYLQGGDPKYWAYDQPELAVIPAGGGTPRLLSPGFDRDAGQPMFAPDGKSVLFQVGDDRAVFLARVPAAGGAVEALTKGRGVIADYAMAPDGRIALLAGTAMQPSEVFALDAAGGATRPLSHQNDAWLAGVDVGATQDVTFTAKDGNEVHGLLLRPPASVASSGARLPTLLRIHGGPHGQDQHDFALERQLFAADGYAVISVNYRGSSGRGRKYAQSIYADWGNKEVVDLLAAADYVVSSGVADADRMGIGGWSYGGILTDYTIATDPRFKAGTSGAGSAMQTAMYGSDQYILQYDTELGPPWKNPKLWEKVSYPFYKNDRITTPTLFMGGEKDFNVPIIGGEQMYQALKSRGIDTELVIYPGQNHGLTTPSYRRDRWQRYLAWYAKYLKGKPKA
jgi:dipeptidyl aminopeptidase/acylaminoacyl peptidase